MDVFAPLYYKDFKCIAEKCTHSCCVSWEIDIDEQTLARYESFAGGYFDKIKESIEYEDTPHFKLCEGERCPHLDCRGLCRIITNCGEEQLCDICREHPRFYNKTLHGLELGLGMACEEAARIILTSDNYTDFIKIEEADTSPLVSDFDAVRERGEVYKILSDKSAPYKTRLETIWNAYGISPSRLSDGEWREELSSLEYLDEAHKRLFLSYTSEAKTPHGCDDMAERALAYFIFRHTASAECAEDFKALLGFACFLERLFASLMCDAENAIKIGRIISEEIEYSEDNTEKIILTFYD